MTSPHLSSQRLAFVAVLAAMALAVLDSGMANVALPHIARHFSARSADAIIVVGAYQVALLAALLPAAHLAPRVGHRRLFRIGIALFATAGLLASIAPSLLLLACARVLQGFGGAAIMALGIAVLRKELGDEGLPQAIASNAFTVAISAAAGPIVGAMLLTFFEPQMLFAAGLPIAAGAFLAASRLNNDKPSAATIDGPSISLHVAVVMAFLATVWLASRSPPSAAASLAMTFVLLHALIRRSREQDAPLLPFDLLSRRTFAMQVAASVTCFVAQSAGLIALSFSVQSPTGPSASTAGLVMASWPLSVAAANMIANRPWFRVKPSLQCGFGAATMAAGLITIALASDQIDPWLLAAGPVLCGIGFGLFQLANNRELFLSVPADRSAATGGMQGTARLSGQTLGTFLVAALFLRVPQSFAPTAAAAVGAVFAAFATVLAIAAGRTPSKNVLPGPLPSTAAS